MAPRISADMLREMYELFASIDDPEVFKVFLDDLCTYKEIEQMAGRIAAAKLFMDGKTYMQVIDATNISSATLSRVSRCVRYGEGYKRVLDSKEEK